MDHDDSGDIWGLLAGSGVFILEICVLVPGLLAFLALAVALTLPLVVLPAIPLALLAGLFFAARGLLRLVIRIGRAIARPRRGAAPLSGDPAASHASQMQA